MNPFKLGLKQVLEDRSIIKVFHDFCEDTSALVRQFEVICDGVFDTQIAHRCLTQASSQDPRDLNIGLNALLQIYTGCQNTEKETIVGCMKAEPHFWWQVSPLSPHLV